MFIKEDEVGIKILGYNIKPDLLGYTTCRDSQGGTVNDLEFGSASFENEFS